MFVCEKSWKQLDIFLLWLLFRRHPLATSHTKYQVRYFSELSSIPTPKIILCYFYSLLCLYSELISKCNEEKKGKVGTMILFLFQWKSFSTTTLLIHFYLRPVLAFGYCRCQHLFPCPSIRVNHELHRVITCHPFKLESPNLDQKCKTPWLRSLLFLGFVALTFKFKFNSKVKITPILSSFAS